jgi:hypothetical protein
MNTPLIEREGPRLLVANEEGRKIDGRSFGADCSECALRDFVRECNPGSQVLFVADVEELARKLPAAEERRRWRARFLAFLGMTNSGAGASK